jgi:hypothetical protein
MASTFVFADILANVAVITNSPAFTASTRITTAQANYWIGQGVRSFSALMRQKFPEDRDLIQSAILPNAPGLALISIPPDAGEVHAVVWQRGTNDSVLLDSANQDDIASSLDTGEDWSSAGVTPRWRLEGQTIAIYPASNSSESIELFYTTSLSSAGTSVVTREDFDRWLACFVGELVAVSKSMTAKAADLRQQKALIENDLLSRARSRDANKTNTIRDVRSIGRSRWGY